jgi:CheY-like chemotaxis protein
LEIERLSAAAIWEPVELTGLLADLRPVLEPLARARNAVLRFLPSRSITVRHADRVLMRQTLLHLLTHALETVRGGEVEVRAIVGSRELGIRVAGVLVPRAGESPTAGTEPSRELEVCRKLIKAMGGRLQVEITPPGSWAAFVAWPDAPSPVLLLIDDNTGFLALFRRYLAEHDWTVIGATSGAEAWSMIAKSRPDVIILDVMMPREDGWDVLMKLKATPETAHIPVLVCSVLNETHLAQSLGAAGYLLKPVTQDALLQALQPWSPGPGSQAPGC